MPKSNFDESSYLLYNTLMQPGQTVSPGGAEQTPTWQFNPDSQPVPEQPEPSSSLPAPVPPAAESTPEPSPVQTEPTPQPTNVAADSDSVNWTASEFIAHSKSGVWYLLLALAAVILAGGIYLLTKDKISTGVIIIVAILFGIAAARKPRQLQYQVNDRGIRIGEKNYPYSTLKSFAIVEEEAVESIWLMPLKRFMPIISIYFDPSDGDKIVEILNQFLPFEDHQPDVVDRLMHRIRF